MPFRTVSGRVRIIDLLKRSIAGGTVPQSLIFSGPAGAGKRAMAIAVAQTLNCTGPGHPTQDPGFDACGTCASCMRIERGVHPDVLIVEPGDSGAIKIEQIRDVIERAAYRPFEVRRRVPLIDHDHPHAARATHAPLKTLDRP